VELSVQVAEGENEPELLLEKVTVPVGVVGVTEVSVTVAVQVVGWLTATDAGVQLTAVEVACGGGAQLADVIVAMTTLLGLMTDTEFEPEFTTYKSVFTGSKTLWPGFVPTETAVRRVLVALLMTVTAA
jgi:hypothetical protein